MIVLGEVAESVQRFFDAHPGPSIVAAFLALFVALCVLAAFLPGGPAEDA